MEEGPLRKTLRSRHSFQWTSGRPRAQRGGVNADRPAFTHMFLMAAQEPRPSSKWAQCREGLPRCPRGLGVTPSLLVAGTPMGTGDTKLGATARALHGQPRDPSGPRVGGRGRLWPGAVSGDPSKALCSRQIPSPQACAGGDRARWWPKEKAASRSVSQQCDGAASETQVAFGGINGSIFSRRKEDTLLYASSDLYALFERGL